jgi:hypothetical protein
MLNFKDLLMHYAIGLLSTMARFENKSMIKGES